MAVSPQSAHPIHTLRETVTALEAAILLCLVKPGKKTVHNLRTSTRRIEAQLVLLTLLPGLPPHQKETSKARKFLKKLRRAAGQVRDLDVQRDLIQSEASAKRAASSDRSEARHLRRSLKHQRDAEAEALLDLLHRRRDKLASAFESLLDALAPAESLTLPQSQLSSIVRRWYLQSVASPSGSHHSIAELHRIRKHAKLARYLAESAPETATTARRLAAGFEQLQQSGGRWHDWLILTEIASHELGRSASLPQRFATHAQDALHDFQQHLRKAPR
jgi:CHAD domain-containing protein